MSTALIFLFFAAGFLCGAIAFRYFCVSDFVFTFAPREFHTKMVDNGNEGAVPPQAQVAAYRVPKIPQFWKADPQAWFTQVEASFRVAGIVADRTKVDHIVASVDQEIVPHITELVNQEPAPADLYRLLKERLLSAFGSSPEARVRQLLGAQLVGNQRPSHLLSQMKALNNGQVNDAVLRSLFIEQLPQAEGA